MTEIKEDAGFTPGPWVWNVAAEQYLELLTEDHRQCVIGVWPTDEGDSVDVSEADAHLIAAAPELYEVLGEIASRFQWEDYTNVDQDDVLLDGKTIIAARAALAKARGE